MKGKPMMVTRVIFQDMPNMKMKYPTALTTLLRNTLMLLEMRSLTWVVSEVRREVMSPVGTEQLSHCGTCESVNGGHGGGGCIVTSPVWLASKNPIS